MSIRAYRINAVQSENSATFNCWRDMQLLFFLSEFECEGKVVSDQRNDDGYGTLSVPIEALEAALKKREELELIDYHVTMLEKDIKYAVENGWECVDYLCC